MTFALRVWAGLCLRRPGLLVVLALLLSLGAAAYSARTLSFSSNRTDMLNPLAPAQKSWQAFSARYGRTIDFMVLAQGPAQECERALDQLSAQLEREPQMFENVFYCLDLPGVGEHALYYLSVADLDRLEQLLSVARPWLHLLTGPNPLALVLDSLRNLNPAAVAQRLTPALPLLNRVLVQVAQSVESRGELPYESPMGTFLPELSALRGKPFQVGQQRFYNTLPDGITYLLMVSAHDRSGSLTADVAAVARLRQLAQAATVNHPAVELTVTGEPVINTEEMVGAQRDALRSGLLALVLVSILLVVGFGAVLRPLCIVLSLILAVVWSCAFAAFSVGQLNLLTVNFATILIGLGMTFGIHILFFFQRQLATGVTLEEALHATLQISARENLVGAITTTVAFWALYFTSFRSAAELGVITGTGVLLCYLATITVLPCLLVLLERHQRSASVPDWVVIPAVDAWLRKRPGSVLGLSLALTLYSISWIPRLPFDYNLLDMQPQDADAIRVERFLHQQGYSALNAVAVADNVDEAVRLTAEFLRQPTVSQVESVASLVAREVQAKQSVIEHIVQASRSLRLPSPPLELNARELLALFQAYQEVRPSLRGAVALWQAGPERVPGREFGRLLERLDASLTLTNPGPVQAGLRAFQSALTADVTAQILFLRGQKATAPDTMAQLPAALALRSLSKDGKIALRIFPRYDVWEREPLERFVRDVQKVDPETTGGPVLIYYYLQELRAAYSVSARNALGVIALLLLWHFRSLTRAALAMLPKLLGMAWMIGIMGLYHVDFNPANFMALPLTLGIGLIFGVQVLQSLLADGKRSLFETSVGPATTLSGLACSIGFATLLTAQHRGVASFGFVMSAGVAANLVTSMVTLPALVETIQRLRTRKVKK